jgi:hypothetical protein
MTMAGSEFAYVQARLQARHGARPDPATWQTLEACHTPGHYLAIARAGALAPWIDGLDENGDIHHIEGHLRTRWRHYVDEVAGWLPARWQAATRWFGSLPELPLAATPGQDADAAHWLHAWQRLMPQGDAPPAVQRTAALLMPTLPGLGGSDTGRGALAEAQRRALLDLFRRRAASAVAVFAHLALVALDVERLRGGIITRVLFEPRHPAGRAPREA